MKKLLLLSILCFNSLFAFEHLTVSNIDETIDNKKVIIDFYATWCPPCKIIHKELLKYDKIKDKSISIYKVDIDKEKDLMERFAINRLPTLMYIENGIILERKVGLESVDELKENEKIFD